MSAEEKLGELLVMLAHDLKNPLAAVVTNLGFVDSALRELGAPEDTGEALADARLACDSLQRILGNLELLARDAANVLIAPPGPESTPLDLGSVADEIVRKHEESATTRKLRLAIRLRDSHHHVWADRDLVVRVVDNLVADAVQHAPLGSEVLVEIGRFPSDPKLVEVAVLDAGPIVPAPMRQEILSPAGQVGSKGLPEGRYGRGLAIYAAALAAGAAGGRMEISERAGKSALSLVLPEHDERVSMV
jgi:signal transduction histidine kinase